MGLVIDGDVTPPPLSCDSSQKSSPENHPGEACGHMIASMTADWRTSTIDTLKGLIDGADPDMVEEVKWRKPSNPDGVPTFSCDGLVCTVETYKDKVKVTFAKGASLPDPTGVFNASLDAGTRRAVDVREGDELDADAFVELVKAAVALNRG